MTGTDEKKIAIGSDVSSAPTVYAVAFPVPGNELAYCKR